MEATKTPIFYSLKKCWELSKPYWQSAEKKSAYFLLILTITCTILSICISVEFNEFYRDFYNALGMFDKVGIIKSLKHFAIIVTLVMLTSGYALYFNSLLCAKWRQWLTKTYLNNWLTQHAHYRLQLTEHCLDNPDQRISEDLNSFPTLTISVMSLILKSTLTLCIFGILLWQLTKSLSFSIGHLNIKSYLFWCAIAYGLIGTTLIRMIGKRLMRLDYLQQYANADFRYALIRLRETSEEIALQKGEDAEKNRSLTIFDKVFNNALQLLSVRFRLTIFTTGFENIALFLGLFLSLPLYLKKQVPLGGMMQISSAFAHVVNAFTSLVSSYSLFAEWRAVILRLSEFNDAIKKINRVKTQLQITNQTSNHFQVKKLSINFPNNTQMLKNIDINLTKGSRTLITGPSGSGKSTLLRTLAGLWPYSEGEVNISKKETLLFLPQTPYLPIGTLQEVLSFPYSPIYSEADLLNALTLTGLIKLHPYLHTKKHWEKILSLGEQQLVTIARVLLYKPTILLMDEATSALSEEMEDYVYTCLSDHLPGTTIISIGHRESLHRLHKQVIFLNSDVNLSIINNLPRTA